jgi:Reverse transcriptase (RNA-dependent DNA polymerase)
MSQYNMKKGIKLFGQDGVDAVLSELSQLHDRNVLDPKNADTLSRGEKKAALEYLMFLKKKRCGRIKGRGCADGRKQRAYTSKEDASSPTVSIEALLLSCVIDAKEKRDVATVDIPGAFMQADMDELVHMRLEGTMAELLVQLDPKLYRKYVQTVNGKSVLYVELKKALYGTMRAALLFWKLLTSKLTAMGFKINPYDWCVANKTIDGNQCTVLWHVDDLKISHVDPNVVTSVIKQLEAEFGKEAPLTIMRGKVHDYLGMTLDYSLDDKVQIKMFDYIDNMVKDLPADMDGESATPAPNHLFEVNAEENQVMLNKEQADMFHHNVAKLLFLCKRARPDIQTAVAFLCTRVKGPDTDDYKKLARVMKYLRGTATMPLVLEAENMNVMKWWVDASFAVHPDMKSHTGGVMSLGRGAVHGTSTRQKINTTSSTEAETVGIHEVLPQILWTRYFLEAQGYGVEESVVYQDNQSAILLAKNGRGSSSKRTRHINIRYFFVADRIASKEVRVEYCPTGEMIADFFTKPLQGTLFRKFRDFIMNSDPLPTSARPEDRRSVLGIIPEARDSNRDSTCLSQNDRSRASDQGSRQTMEVWTDVDHGKRMNGRHRILQKKILAKRTRVG